MAVLTGQLHYAIDKRCLVHIFRSCKEADLGVIEQEEEEAEEK